MLERLTGLRERLGFAELVVVFIVGLSFAIGGLMGGTPITILHTCSGLAQAACEGSSDSYVALNPAPGLLAAAGAVLALIAIDSVMKLRGR